MKVENLSLPRVAIVSSSGTPLALVRSLRAIYSHYAHVYYLVDSVIPADDMVGRMEVFGRPSRLGGSLHQFLRAWNVLGVQRPSLALTVSSREAFPIVMACVVRQVPVLLIQVADVGYAAWFVRRLWQLIALWVMSFLAHNPPKGRELETAVERQRQAEGCLRLLTPDLACSIDSVLSLPVSPQKMR